jgi:hypothetical protein
MRQSPTQRLVAVPVFTDVAADAPAHGRSGGVWLFRAVRTAQRRVSTSGHFHQSNFPASSALAHNQSAMKDVLANSQLLCRAALEKRLLALARRGSGSRDA